MRGRTIWLISAISLAAGLLYDSWPLGYWLNPFVAKRSLASGLEAIHQPYNWVFIAADIASSVFIIITCGLLWRMYKNSKASLPIQLALGSIVLFAAGTVADALLPEDCVPNLMKCQSFTHDHALLLHGIFSIAASLFLFVALIILWIYRRKNLILDSLLAGYVVFGIISLVQAVTPGNNGNWSENYYITLCSIWLVFLPYTISLLGNKIPQETEAD
jgi:hypothetical protein